MTCKTTFCAHALFAFVVVVTTSATVMYPLFAFCFVGLMAAFDSPLNSEEAQGNVLWLIGAACLLTFSICFALQYTCLLYFLDSVLPPKNKHRD